MKQIAREAGKKTAHPDQTLYRIMQPTGLMYGQSSAAIDLPGSGSWTSRDRLKILLTESLISCSLVFSSRTTKVDDIDEVIHTTLMTITNFYNNIFPEIATPTRNLFGKKKSTLEIVERIIEKRVEAIDRHNENFWSSFFHHCLLFLDVYIFGQWMHTNADRIVTDFFRYEREELRFSVIKVIGSASHANKEVVYEEKRLLDIFMETVNLSSEKKKEALRIFEEGISVEDINLPSENSWILKKFFLEVAILTLWVDKRVEQTELDYLKSFSHYLDFSDDDLENSMIAIEGFVLENWDQLEYLQNKQDFQQVSDQFIQRLARIADRNKSKLRMELDRNSIIVGLLRKGRSFELAEAEQEILRIELIKLLKNLPVFQITNLPQKFLTYSNLKRVLPVDLIKESI